jgi:hypothetical protein
MRPRPRPGTREGMTAASGTARTAGPNHGTDLNNRICPARPPAPVSRRQIIGHPAGHLKDACGAAPAAGLRPVLDLPGRSPRTWQPEENRRRQSPMPESSQHRSKTPL